MPDFDINGLRAAVTLLSFISFLGIVAWALSKRNQAGFDEAARLPFADDRTGPPRAVAGRAALSEMCDE